MKTLVALCAGFFAVLLTGCVSVKPVTLSDGTVGHAISCNGTARNMGDCAAKAGEICGAAGYTVMHQDASSTLGIFTASTANRTMSVKCGKNG